MSNINSDPTEGTYQGATLLLGAHFAPRGDLKKTPSSLYSSLGGYYSPHIDPTYAHAYLRT
jgi:hypothetical protein